MSYGAYDSMRNSPPFSAHRKNRRSSYGDRQSTVRFGRSKASEVLGELSVKEVQVGFPEGQPTSATAELVWMVMLCREVGLEWLKGERILDDFGWELLYRIQVSWMVVVLMFGSIKHLKWYLY